jgi:MinD superfamily P-loop ATPase
VKELVVISGKGGTGKTSIAAACAALEGRLVTADCDVDAANLHLLLEPRILNRWSFISGKCAEIDHERCIGCGLCMELCRFGAVSRSENMRTAVKRLHNPTHNNAPAAAGEMHGDTIQAVFTVDETACEGCGVCVYHCPAEAISFAERENGEYFLSETRFGPLVHARLRAGGENSGKLVSAVRSAAKKAALDCRLDLIIIDGAPGIGCPVISSLTGADLALVVTEPTRSGLHDLERILRLTEHFAIETMVVVNKYDINESIKEEIERCAVSRGCGVAGGVRYDESFTRAQIEGKSIVEYTDSPAAQDVREIWAAVHHELVREDT